MAPIADIITLMRPYQWLKNLFVLTPVFFAGDALYWGMAGRSLIAMATFCLASSAVYALDDTMDAELDRLHPRKKTRPVASGRLSPTRALTLAAILAAVALGGAALLSWGTALSIAAYLVLMTGYCLGLKNKAVLDALIIGVGFILRLTAGSMAAGVYLSSWILLCTMSLSLLLAFGKRRQELVEVGEDSIKTRPSLSGYSLGMLDQVMSIVSTTSVVCYLLYVSSAETIIMVVDRRGAMLTALFVLYGIFRYLALVYRHGRGGDPARILWQDRPLQAACLGWALLWALLIYLG